MIFNGCGGFSKKENDFSIYTILCLIVRQGVENNGQGGKYQDFLKFGEKGLLSHSVIIIK